MGAKKNWNVLANDLPSKEVEIKAKPKTKRQPAVKEKAKRVPTANARSAEKPRLENLSIRLDSTQIRGLKKARADREFDQGKATLQDIHGEAIDMWLEANGYSEFVRQ